jgi:hypothetical protein
VHQRRTRDRGRLARKNVTGHLYVPWLLLMRIDRGFGMGGGFPLHNVDPVDSRELSPFPGLEEVNRIFICLLTTQDDLCSGQVYTYPLCRMPRSPFPIIYRSHLRFFSSKCTPHRGMLFFSALFESSHQRQPPQRSLKSGDQWIQTSHIRLEAEDQNQVFRRMRRPNGGQSCGDCESLNGRPTQG